MHDPMHNFSGSRRPGVAFIVYRGVATAQTTSTSTHTHTHNRRTRNATEFVLKSQPHNQYNRHRRITFRQRAKNSIRSREPARHRNSTSLIAMRKPTDGRNLHPNTKRAYIAAQAITMPTNNKHLISRSDQRGRQSCDSTNPALCVHLITTTPPSANHYRRSESGSLAMHKNRTDGDNTGEWISSTRIVAACTLIKCTMNAADDCVSTCVSHVVDDRWKFHCTRHDNTCSSARKAQTLN